MTDEAAKRIEASAEAMAEAVKSLNRAEIREVIKALLVAMTYRGDSDFREHAVALYSSALHVVEQEPEQFEATWAALLTEAHEFIALHGTLLTS